MRVMMIGPFPRSPDRIDGGVAAAITYLSQALVKMPGVELVGVRIAWDAGESRTSDGMGWPIDDLALDRMSLSTLYWRQKRRLRELIRHYQPTVIHAQGTDVAGFLAIGCGLPAVVTVHGILGECAKFQTDLATKARAKLASLLTERRTIRRATDLIAISPYVTRYYQSEISGRVHEIPNAVAWNFFQVVRTPQRGRVLFAGRIANGKGLLELLRAVAGNPDVVRKLVLAGAAPDIAYERLVRNETQRLGLANRVEFAGLLSERNLLKEFGLAEVLVLPSYQETAPMVVQQAMASGLAVIATRVGGIPFQIEHDVTGLLFEPGDVGELTRLIERIGNEPTLSRRLGNAAKEMAVAKYDAEGVARATLTVYQSMFSSHKD